MRQRLLIIASGILILVGIGVVGVLLVNRSPKLQNTVLKIANSNSAVTTTNQATTNTTVATTADADAAAITYAARNFSEQYGSGSNQNDFANLVVAQRWGTKGFNEFLNRSIVQQRQTNVTTPFHSFVTQALVMNITAHTTQIAAVTVSTQRQETTGQAAKTYYQDIQLNFLKEGSDWRVNAAAWKPVSL